MLGVMAMKMMKAAVAALAGAAALACAGAASATTYFYTLSKDLGNGNYGTVDVTGSSTDLHFVISLTGGNQLQDSGAHELFTGLLGGSGFALIAPVNSGITFSTDLSDNISNSPYTGFNIALNCTTNCGTGGNNVYGPSLTFDITGTNLSVQQAGTINGTAYYFASDINKDGKTGAVAATLTTSAVPEPAMWAMMLVGFGGLGAMLRLRRREGLAAA